MNRQAWQGMCLFCPFPYFLLGMSLHIKIISSEEPFSLDVIVNDVKLSLHVAVQCLSATLYLVVAFSVCF